MTKRGKKSKRRNKNKIPAAAASAPPPWTDLPSDLTANILQRLGTEEILQSAQFVCTTWRNVCRNPILWREINFINCDYSFEQLTMMCRRAVDLSQGQLIRLTISYFGDDELLLYIADKSSHLQRLTLDFCSDLSSTTLIEAFKKLPELEELDLIVPLIQSEDIEAIGVICPMLKSFTHKSFCEFTEAEYLDRNKLAFAIAKSMPNLYHLGLIGNGLCDEGLQAILDGCPHLVSLDIRQCMAVCLEGAVGERCRKQINHLRHPDDSVDDNEWDDINLFNDAYSPYSHSPDWGYYDDGYESYDDYTDPFRPEYCDSDVMVFLEAYASQYYGKMP